MAYEDEPVLGVPGGAEGVLGSQRHPIAARRAQPQPQAAPNLRPDPVEEEPDFTGPVGRYQRMSTRMPEGEGAEDWRKGHLTVDMAAMRRDPKFFANVVNDIKEMPNLTEKEKTGKEEKVAENFRQHLMSNFHFLRELAPHPDINERNRRWYPGGNRIISERANHFSVPMNSATGTYSTQSPQKIWHMNVSLGDRVLHTVFKRGKEQLSNAMLQKAYDVWHPKEGTPEPETDRQKMELAAKLDLLRHLEESRNNTLNEHLVDLHDKLKSGKYTNTDIKRVGAWVRLFDEVNHDPRYAIISPEGDYLDFATTQEGKHALRTWGANLEAGRGAASAILRGDLEQLRKLQGGNHKVPSFDPNLGDPYHPALDVTADTHVAAGGLLRPLGGAHKHVAAMMAGRTSKLHGLSGWYGIATDAVREAAAEHGWRPNEGQGVFWGAAQGLFHEDYKKKHNQDAIADMWLNRGNKPIRKVQEQIYEHARKWNNERAAKLRKKGLDVPDWEPGRIGYPDWYGLQRRPGLRWDFFV